MSEESDTNIDRRRFLKRTTAGALGFGGLVSPGQLRGRGELGGQDEPERARITRRIALDYPERLDGGPRQKILLLTDRTNENPDVSEVNGCNFSNWPTDQLTIWEGIIVDWENASRDLGFGLGGGTPTIRANRLVELDNIFVDEQQTPVPLGTPYIVNRVRPCPGDYLGLNASKIPGIDIKTGPDVSTSG